MAASPSETVARQRATYQDVLDAPAHQVAEVVDGTLHTHPRPAMPHARASYELGIELGGPFHRGRGGPGAGGLPRNRSCTFVTTSWFRTSQDGAASGCRSIPRPPTSPFRRTGRARSCPPRPAGSTCMASARSMPAVGRWEPKKDEADGAIVSSRQRAPYMK